MTRNNFFVTFFLTIRNPYLPSLQTIDAINKRAKNEECIKPLPFLPVIKNSVDASIIPETKSKVKVRFETFNLGPISFQAKNAENFLDTTYLDKDLRISRGGRGNIFVLCREE